MTSRPGNSHGAAAARRRWGQRKGSVVEFRIDQPPLDHYFVARVRPAAADSGLDAARYLHPVRGLVVAVVDRYRRARLERIGRRTIEADIEIRLAVDPHLALAARGQLQRQPVGLAPVHGVDAVELRGHPLRLVVDERAI